MGLFRSKSNLLILIASPNPDSVAAARPDAHGGLTLTLDKIWHRNKLLFSQNYSTSRDEEEQLSPVRTYLQCEKTSTSHLFLSILGFRVESVESSFTSQAGSAEGEALT